ncbi:uncharacterized protein MONOS_17091 [Monocercomonoides exilis]|uniref:uncharacterized protein n=1 Tax=Monocercomonoides exilis TaxID=2049356 RepID=UPI003559970D|nr:hypothetical protein MONOS_17091 [Monocercomonoides exilis]
MALSCIREYFRILKKLYLEEISEIIQQHQEHHNLTRIAYESAWKFLIKRLFTYRKLEDIIVKDLHFFRETSRELDDLRGCVDWKKKEEESGREKSKEETNLWGWLIYVENFFVSFRKRNGEIVGLVNSVTDVFREAKENYGKISCMCVETFKFASQNRAVEIDDLLKGGAVDMIFEEIQRATSKVEVIGDCLKFFLEISEKLKGKMEKEREEMKRKMFDKMEEEGYDDTITSFHKALQFIRRNCYNTLSLRLEDYFVSI